jgi:D-alanyl-D-alanine carboxypeptidase
MKKTRIFLTLLGLVSCRQELFFPAPGPPSRTDSTHSNHAEYRGYLTAYQRQTRAPGALLLVARGDQPRWVGAVGYADLTHSTPFSTETPFRVGSITKVFVSTLALQLVQEKKLALEEPITRYLPELTDRIPGAGRITVRHLLAHTSGLVDPPNQSLTYQTDLVNNPATLLRLSGRERLRAYVWGKPLRFEPGSDYSYSNAGYWLLEWIIETVSREQLSLLLTAKLFRPLGLGQTYLAGDEPPNGKIVLPARGYAVTTPGTLRDVTDWDRAEGTGNAAGGIVSTAGDLHRFYTALFGGDLLRPDLRAEMQRQQLVACRSAACAYGLGLEIWQIGGNEAYGHNGALVGIEANALYVPATKMTLVLYKNLGGGSDKTFLDQLAR